MTMLSTNAHPEKYSVEILAVLGYTMTVLKIWLTFRSALQGASSEHEYDTATTSEVNKFYNFLATLYQFLSYAKIQLNED